MVAVYKLVPSGNYLAYLWFTSTTSVCATDHIQERKLLQTDKIVVENEIFFELKSKDYRDGIKRKETR